MKLVRLPSGPLACVFPVDATTQRGATPEPASGVYRAFSGSVEAMGDSETEALEALDERVRRLSQPPATGMADLSHEAANDLSDSSPLNDGGPGLARASERDRRSRFSDFDTMPAPASSSRR